MNFIDKLNGAIAHQDSLLCVRLDPEGELEALPHRAETGAIARWQAWAERLIEGSADLVCAYKIIPEFYLALGPEGLQLLKTVLAAIPPAIPVILDAKYAHLNTSATFAETIFRDWGVDAVTVSPFAGQDQVAPFLVYPDKAVFVLSATANPAAAVLQHYPVTETPFYLHLVNETKSWGTPDQVGLEVGAGPEVLAKIRALVPERSLLVQDTWKDTAALQQLVTAGLNANGDGMIVLAPKELLTESQPGVALRALRDQINQIRVGAIGRSPRCEVWLPDQALPHRHPHEDLIVQLFDIGCLRFGDYVQASGATFPYYIDLRTIISNPQIFDAVISAYADILKTLRFERIAGIPYGSLPTATGLSLRLGYPMIFPRKEVKAHGTRRLVEGEFHGGEQVVVVDDILISGKSAIEGAQKLQSVGLTVQDIVVFIDHGNGVMDRLQAQGYRGHAVLTLTEIAETLRDAGRITADQGRLLLEPEHP
jgi:uridine monophosphate synthetase